jgi:hypothetical protein
LKEKGMYVIGTLTVGVSHESGVVRLWDGTSKQIILSRETWEKVAEYVDKKLLEGLECQNK